MPADPEPGQPRRRRKGRARRGAIAVGVILVAALVLPAGPSLLTTAIPGVARHRRVSAAERPRTTVASRTAPAGRQPRCPWLNSRLPVATRVSELLRAMSARQEAELVHLYTDDATHPYEGFTPAIPALCLPRITEQDGSAGVANSYSYAPDVWHSFRGVTQLPDPINDAAAFDPSLARAYGTVIGAQDVAKGIDMALAPTLNIDRSPQWGRSYESLGEDPYLTAALGVPLVEGIQSHRVVAVVKHFAAYNQETYRKTRFDDAFVSSRALREIYLPAFAAAVQRARPGGLMCSYNLINGVPACQDRGLLGGILRRQWGFAGFVRSDCGSIFNQAAAMAAGVSQAKCTRLYRPVAVADLVSHHLVTRAALNALARPLLTVLFRFDLIAAPHPGTPSSPLPAAVAAAGEATALRTADESAVLLRNAGHLLPLRFSRLRSVALIGRRNATPMPSGFGAIHVRAWHPVSVLAALRARLGRRLIYTPGTDLAAAVTAAREAQVAVVVVADYEQEARDRPSLRLPLRQDALVQAVAHANPNTVVVLETGSAVLLPWLARVRAVLETWYPGQVAGASLVRLLSGAVDPSGKLPVTFPATAGARPDATRATFGGLAGRTRYTDGIDVGYRWYEVHRVRPAFPFGFGLSYTTFRFSGLQLRRQASGAVTVAATVTNTGRVAGADVAQCYVGDPAAAGEPPRQLRGFQRVSLAPGQSAAVTMTVTRGDLAYWDTAAGTWRMAPGTYQFWVGDASATADLPLHGALTLPGARLGVDSGPAPPG